MKSHKTAHARGRAKYHGHAPARKYVRPKPPSPRRVMVVGKLDMFCQSSRNFGLILDSGVKTRGIYLGDDIKGVSKLLGKRVSIQGHAVYRPSGEVLCLDAEKILRGAGEPAILSKIPPPMDGSVNYRKLRQKQTATNGLAAIIGKWPGDETDEEIFAALEEMS